MTKDNETRRWNVCEVSFIAEKWERTMNILGITSSSGHDPSAALLINGKVVAAAEEERFVRKKHAIGLAPLCAMRYCLDYAGLKPSQIDLIAYPWSLSAFKRSKREVFRHFLFRDPCLAYEKIFCKGRAFRNHLDEVQKSLSVCGFHPSQCKIAWVEHHLSHMASSFFLSGFKDAAVISIDGDAELASMVMGWGAGQVLQKTKQVLMPDSLGNFYSTITDYLGFQRSDGEYKVMGMAPYGDAQKADLSCMIWWNEKKKSFQCGDNYVFVKKNKRLFPEKVYSKAMVERFGPQRYGDGLSQPYIHIAAAAQENLETAAIRMIDVYLQPYLKKSKRLCFAGACALNVSLNKRIISHPLIEELWVQPASHDAGTSLGAALYAAAAHNETIHPLEHAYLGPEFSNEDIFRTIKSFGFRYSYLKDIAQKTAHLLSKGEIVGWFQGRMEWGPRALGNRSIVANPALKGAGDKINETIKLREKWRPFCPSILEEFAFKILEHRHPAPFMTVAFRVSPIWKGRIQETVHVNGTCRPQIVKKETNPKFYSLIKAFYEKTGIPAVINTSLNRRGEPMACSPLDAMVMLRDSGLKYLAMGDFLIEK